MFKIFIFIISRDFREYVAEYFARHISNITEHVDLLVE